MVAACWTDVFVMEIEDHVTNHVIAVVNLHYFIELMEEDIPVIINPSEELDIKNLNKIIIIIQLALIIILIIILHRLRFLKKIILQTKYQIEQMEQTKVLIDISKK